MRLLIKQIGFLDAQALSHMDRAHRRAVQACSAELRVQAQAWRF